MWPTFETGSQTMGEIRPGWWGRPHLPVFSDASASLFQASDSKARMTLGSKEIQTGPARSIASAMV